MTSIHQVILDGRLSQLNLHFFEFRNLCTWLYDTVIIEYRKEKTLKKFNKDLKKIAELCGIDVKITSYVARHSFATNYLESEGKIENLQVILGHTSIVTTMKYVHVLKENAALTVNLI